MKFIWKIENFGKLKGGKLLSPPFSSHSTTWEVIIPEDSFKYSEFKVELHCIKGSIKYVQGIPKNCLFALLDFEGLPIVWQDGNIICQCNPYNYTYTIQNVVASLTNRINIFSSRKAEFLPNDILTVECHLWDTVVDLDRPLSIFARSRVESEIKKSFEWNISKANLFQDGYILEHVEPLINGEFLTITFTNQQNSFKFESKVSMFRCKMEIKIMLLDAIKMRKVQISNHDYNFTIKDEKWAFATKMSRNIIVAHQNRLLSDNTVTMHFICSFKDSVTVNRIVDENEILSIPRSITASSPISKAAVPANKSEIHQPADKKEILNLPKSIATSSTTSVPADKSEIHQPLITISQSLQELLKEGLLSDFNLKVKDRLFPVHKAILSARSPVFRAMFTTEMKEKEVNFVNIPDVAEDILQRLLQFVYSDEFDEGMDCETASDLYAAADKYALEPLKIRCSAVLKSGFCISNVLEGLVLADMHDDQHLKSAAFSFISSNHQDIVGTEVWNKFEKDNAQLALDTFRSLYLKKMKG